MKFINMEQNIQRIIFILMICISTFDINFALDDKNDKIKLKPREKNSIELLIGRFDENVTLNCRIDQDHSLDYGEDITIKRSWSRQNGKWLGPIRNSNGEMIGIDKRIKFQSENKQDEASEMNIFQLNANDEGLYYCSVWSVSNNNSMIISKNETIQYELKIEKPQSISLSTIDNLEPVKNTVISNNDVDNEITDVQGENVTSNFEEDDDYYDDQDLEEEEVWSIPLDSEPKFVENDNEKFYISNVNDLPSSMIIEQQSGHTAKLRCPIRGHPNNTIYKWYKNSHLLRGSHRKNGEPMMIDKWKLNLENIEESDSANYTCVAINPFGRYNFTFYLRTHYSLRHPPVLINLNVKINNTIFEGENITFDCRYKSSVNANFSWFRVYPNNTYRKIIGSRLMLDLQNVTMNDSGNYSCIVSNPYGTIERYFYLNVISAETFFLQPYVQHMLFILCATLIFITLLISYAVYQSRMETNKKITIVAQKSFIIKKKIILENPISELQNGESVTDFSDQLDAKTAFDMFSPLVKIDYEHILIDSNSEETKSGETQYEIPLDKEWELERSKILIKEKLGEGEFGIVVKGEIDDTYRKEVAIKMLKDGHSDDEIINLISEVELMKRIGKHRNIINLIGCCTQNGPLYVIVEYAPYGNLRDFLRKEMIALKNRKSTDHFNHYVPEMFQHQNQQKHLTFIDLVNFAFQVARGMEYLASKRCVHRDLAARNVLVCDDNVLKIADFGLARRIQGDYYRKTTNGRLPIKWMAIESLENQVYTTQSDVWSFGILVWEIMTLGRTPYPGTNVQELWKRLECGYRMEKPVNCDDQMYAIMRKCWAAQPNERPSFTELVKEIDRLLDIYTNKVWSPDYAEISFQGIDTLSSSSEEDTNETTTIATNEYDNDRLMKKEISTTALTTIEPRYKNWTTIQMNPPTVLSIDPEQLPGKWFNMNTLRSGANHHYINGIALRETLRQQYDNNHYKQQQQQPECDEDSINTGITPVIPVATIMHNQIYMNGNSIAIGINNNNINDKNETINEDETNQTIIAKPLTWMNKCYDLTNFLYNKNHPQESSMQLTTTTHHLNLHDDHHYHHNNNNNKSIHLCDTNANNFI